MTKAIRRDKNVDKVNAAFLEMEKKHGGECIPLGIKKDGIHYKFVMRYANSGILVKEEIEGNPDMKPFLKTKIISCLMGIRDYAQKQIDELETER